MQNFKLFHILSQFDKLEQNRIRKFINSPYFNKDKVVCNLFEILVEEINTPSKTNWTKEKIWEHLVPDLSFDDTRLRKYQSDLLKLIEKFLIQEEFETDVFNSQSYLLRSIKRKKLKKLHNSVRKSMNETSVKTIYRDNNFFLNLFVVESSYAQLITDMEEKSTEKTNLETMSNLIDAFYLGEKLKIYCEVLSRKKFVQHEYDISLIKEVLEITSRNEFQELPHIAIYSQIVKLYIEPQILEHYYKYQSLLSQSSHLFPPNEEKNLYILAQNYCVNQLNQGNSHFLIELFDVYKNFIEKDFFKLEGSLDSFTFKNIVVVGLRNGAYEWTEKFILNYINSLPPEIRENTLSFNLSQLYFYQKKYSNVVKILQEVEYNDYITNCNAKTTLIGAYYEEGEFEPLFSLLESFRVYLNRNKEIPLARKINYKNLIRFTKKLISLPPTNKKAFSQLKAEVEATKNIPSRDWLLEKITELE